MRRHTTTEEKLEMIEDDKIKELFESSLICTACKAKDMAIEFFSAFRCDVGVNCLPCRSKGANKSPQKLLPADVRDKLRQIYVGIKQLEFLVSRKRRELPVLQLGETKC